MEMCVDDARHITIIHKSMRLNGRSAIIFPVSRGVGDDDCGSSNVMLDGWLAGCLADFTYGQVSLACCLPLVVTHIYTCCSWCSPCGSTQFTIL